MWLDPPRRGLSDARDPGDRDLVRRHLRGRARRAPRAVSVVSSQAELHARFGGIVPEVASRRHLELVDTVVDAALAEAGIELGRRRRARRDQRPRADRRSARRRQRGEGASRRGQRKPLVARRPPPRAHRLAAPRARAARAALPLPVASGGHTLLAGGTRARRLRAARPDARRRRRRGARQGARACSALDIPGGPAIEREPPRRATPMHSSCRSRWRQASGLDFSFSGLKTALVYMVAELGRGRLEGAPRAISPRASRPPSSTS